jgi:hypothetical protein
MLMHLVFLEINRIEFLSFHDNTLRLPIPTRLKSLHYRKFKKTEIYDVFFYAVVFCKEKEKIFVLTP